MYETSGIDIREGQDIQTADSVVRYLREQRHDFMNHIQVIWGYLQLGRADQSAKYIKDMNRRFDVLGRVLRLNNPLVSLFFYRTIKRANNCGIDVDLEMEETEFDKFFTFEVNIKLDILEKACDEILKMSLNRDKDKEIYIDIFVEDEVLHIEISNNREFCINEGKNCDDNFVRPILDIKKGIDVIYHTGGDGDCQVNISFKA